MKIDTLYIIGNGFDLFHNLRTSYGDFHKYVSTNNTELENNFEEYFDFRISDNRSWTNFEEDLGTFNWKLFFDDNCHIDILDDNFRPSFTFSLEDDLQELTEHLISDIRKTFSDWLTTVDLKFTQKKLVLRKDSFFINFNYTMTLEKVYEIETERVLHIHNDVDDDPETLIFGHNTTLAEVSELDENGDSNRTIFTDSEGAAMTPLHQFRKPVENVIAENDKAFESVCNVKNVFVLGHSLNQIDIPYFREIFNRTKDAKWNVSYYKENETDMLVSALHQIGASQESIKLFQL